MPDPLTPGDGQDLLARYKQAWEQRDPDLFLDLFADDAEYRPDPFEPALSGAIAIRKHWNRVAAEQAHVDFDAERVWTAGRTVLASWHAAYTRRETADRLRERGFLTAELDDAGRVARLRQWSLARHVGTDDRFAAEGDVGGGEEQDGR